VLVYHVLVLICFSPFLYSYNLVFVTCCCSDSYVGVV